MYERIKRHEPWVLHHIPQKGRGAIDVGANAGTFALDLAGTFEQVWAFEPDPRAFEELEALSTHPSLPHLHVSSVAVGEMHGYLDLWEFEESVHTSAYIGPEFEPGRSKATGNKSMVEVVPLDLVSFSSPIDFVKVDVEGGEKEVLKGSNQLIRDHRPWWLVEIHSDSNEVWCVNFFQVYEYTVERIAHPYGESGHCWIVARDKREPVIHTPKNLGRARNEPALV